MVELAIALLALQTRPPQSYDLRWKPTLGEIHQYQVSVRFDYGGVPLDFKADLQLKVTKVQDDGGYSVETETTNGSYKVGSNHQDMQPAKPQTQTYDKYGTPTSKADSRDPDPFADLLDHLTEFQAPTHSVRVGDVWHNRPWGPKGNLYEMARVSYSLASIERSTDKYYAKVAYTVSQDRIQEQAKGMLLLSRPGNALFHFDVHIPHFKPPDTSEDAAVDVVVQEK